MYNRYIPQPDGSYRRCIQQNQTRPPRPQPQKPPQNQEPPRSPEPELELPCPPPQEEHRREPRQEQPRATACRSGQSITNFLRQLLPRDFDTADLLIVLLLLLMAGDNQEDQNTAMLTLALYLFM